MQSPSAYKDISIKSNQTFLLEFFSIFFHIYSNKTIEAFKKKYRNDIRANNLNALNLDYLYKYKLNNLINNNNNNSNLNNDNNQYPLNKDKSDYYLNLIDDKNKNIINDKNIFELNENINLNGDINYPKLSIFGNPSLNNFPSSEGMLFKNLPSKSINNSLNRIPSFSNINNMNLNPHKMGFFDMYMGSNIGNINSMNNMHNMSLTSLKNSNANLFNGSNSNLFQLNPEKIVRESLLTPPQKFTLGKPPTIPPVTTNNNANFAFTSSLGDNNIQNENEKKSSTLNMFNKKRKRDFKNNKLVFILGDNKKEKKDKDKENDKNKDKIITNNINITDNTETTPNQTQTNNLDSNDQNSEKSKKPRGSKYRGVSRNGNQWQVLIMVNKKKRYVGSYSKEEEAAKAYDKVALQNHGTKAKTNFDYTKKEVENILASPHLLKLY